MNYEELILELEAVSEANAKQESQLPHTQPRMDSCFDMLAQLLTKDASGMLPSLVDRSEMHDNIEANQLSQRVAAIANCAPDSSTGSPLRKLHTLISQVQELQNIRDKIDAEGRPSKTSREAWKRILQTERRALTTKEQLRLACKSRPAVPREVVADEMIVYLMQLESRYRK